MSVRRDFLALCLLALLTLPALARDPGQIDQLRQRLGTVRGRLTASQRQLNAANRKERAMARQLSGTAAELRRTGRSLRKTRRQLARAETRLDRIRRQVRRSEVKLHRSQVALEHRLRDIYEQGRVSYLAVVLQSENFTDYLNQSEYLHRILASDHKLIQNVRRHKAQLDQEKSAARQTVLEMQALNRTYQQKVAGLESLQHTQSQLVHKVRAQRQRLSAYVDGLEELSSSMERRLEHLTGRGGSTWGGVPLSAGRFIWPVHGPITSPFGYRFHPILHKVLFHTGIDIAVPIGTPVHAADNGIVIYAGWCGGYGYAVIIKHADNYSTLYGHNSHLLVHVGERVAQGQVISLSGSTGMSTGPHVHFEIRKNGVPIDPMGRLPRRRF